MIRRRRPIRPAPDPTPYLSNLATMRQTARRERHPMSTDTLSFVDPDTFGDAFDVARATSSAVADATSPFTHVPNTAYVLTADLLSGYAIRPDGELVNVFSLVPGRGDMLVSHAVANGADHLDCFDGYLPTLYARHGFMATHREQNWTPGGPDVVYMSTPGAWN